MEPRSTGSGSDSGDAGTSRRSVDSSANLFTSMKEYRENYRLQNGVPPDEQHKDKFQSRSSVNAPPPYGLIVSSVPRLSGPGPPPQFPNSSTVYSGGTLPVKPPMASLPPGGSGGPPLSIKRSPKVKIFQKREKSAADMLGVGSRETVIHNGQQRVTVESTPQVVYAASPSAAPAMHRHLPNVSAHRPVSTSTVRKKSSKKPSASPVPSPSPSPLPLPLSSTSSSPTVFGSGLGVFYQRAEKSTLPNVMPKPAKNQHVPLPAHARPPTPAQGSMLTVSQKGGLGDNPSTLVKDVPLDLSRDTYTPIAMPAMGSLGEVPAARTSTLGSDSVQAGDCPLDLSVKKRPYSRDGTHPEPMPKRQAVEVVGMAGKLKFTRPVAHSDVKQRMMNNNPYVGITFGNPRVAPVGIATATAHSQERLVDVDGPRTPRPAHVHPAAGVSAPPLADFASTSDGRTPKDMVVVGRRSPILGGQCTVTPSLRHTDVVNVRGKPFKVSTVRPQVNGRPVITTRSFPTVTTTTTTSNVMMSSMAPSNSSVSLNVTLGSGPLGCLKLSSFGLREPPLSARGPSKLCEAETIRNAQGPTYVMMGSASSRLLVNNSSTQQGTSSSTEVRHSAGAESSEEGESACQAPLLNIPKFQPSKAKTKSKKSSKPPLVINIPDQINSSSKPAHTSSPSLVVPPVEDPQPRDTQCVSISTQTVDENEDESHSNEKADGNEDSEDDGPIIVDDFPPPDEPVDLKELYPTPSRTLMCARKSTTKQSKRLLQQILESRSPPKLSVISPGQKATLPDTLSSPPPHMPILSPHRSPPTLVPQALPKVKPESLTSLETLEADPDMCSSQGGKDSSSDCDRAQAVTVVGMGSKAALSIHKHEADIPLTHSKNSYASSSSKDSKKSSQKTQALLGTLSEDSSSISADTEGSTPSKSVSVMCSNSSVSGPSTSVAPSPGCLLAKILVAQGECQIPSRSSPQLGKISQSQPSDSHSPPREDSDTDSDKLRHSSETPAHTPPATSGTQRGTNIFEKFQALAEEARGNCEDADTSDELSLMCWEQMAASPPSEKPASPATKEKSNTLTDEKPQPDTGDKDNVDALSESSDDSTNSVIAKALPKVTNVSAFMPTTKTKLTPLHYASIRDNLVGVPKRGGSPVPIENTRFYQANILRGSLNRSTSSPALETMNCSKSNTPDSLSRSMSNTPQPTPVFLQEELEDWQIEHVNYQTTKLRRPPVLVTIPRTAPRGTVMRRLSPEGLYDFCPSAQYGKAKACMAGDSHSPVFTPIRNLSMTSVHGLARLATLDLSTHQPRTSRTVAEYNRARTAHCSQRKMAETTPVVVTGTDATETWTMVKEVSPRKPGSPAAARHKESSGTLVTVLRRERSRDDSGSSSKSPIQFQRDKPPSNEQLYNANRSALSRSDSETSRSHSPAAASGAESDRPKLTLIYSEGKVKIAHSKKKSSKSSKPEKHRRCSYTIKGDPLEVPPVPRDPTSPQPKLSPIRLVASPPRRRKSSKKSESKSPPGSPRLTFVSSPVPLDSSIVSDNPATVNYKSGEESTEGLKIVVPKRPKIKIPEMKNEASQLNESQDSPTKPVCQSPPISALKIRVDQSVNPPKRVMSPLRINIKSPQHTADQSLSGHEPEIQKERNILYDLPTSPELSADESMFTALVAETIPTPPTEEPPKKKEKKASKKHKKDKKRDSSKEKSKTSDGKKEKKEKKNREKEREKDLVDGNVDEKEKSGKKKGTSEYRKDKSDKKLDLPDTDKEVCKKNENKDGQSKKKEGREHKKVKSEPVEDEPPKDKLNRRLKSSHKKRIAERRKLKAAKRREGEKDNEQNKEKSDRSERRKGGRKKKSGSKKSKKQQREEERLAAEANKKPKRRSLLAELANSDGYVAEKNLDQKKCRDLYADPAKLGREERALLRAMMQFSEMEQSGTDSADHLSATSDKFHGKKPEQTSARRKAQALTKCALKRARNKGGCSKRPKFDDFVPEILPSRTRTQAAELANRKKEPIPTTSDDAETKGRRRHASNSAELDAKPGKSCQAKKRSKGEDGDTADAAGQWEILPEDQPKPVVPVKRKRGFASRLTMKIQWKSALWEKYVQNQRRRGRPSKISSDREWAPTAGRKLVKTGKTVWGEQPVKEEPAPAAEIAESQSQEEAGEETGAEMGHPTLEDIKVKQEPLESEMLVPLLRPDPVAAPSPAPSTSTGLSVGGTEEYWPVPECVKKMSVNQNTGETILHKAARLGYEDVARYCAQTDYLDLDARDHAGYTAMHECCSQGHILVSKLLIEGGASVNLASCDGMRPLHDAVENDLMEMVRLLLARGADPKLATYSGKTVLGLTKQKEMLSFLTGYYQDLNGCRQPQPEIPWSFNGSSVCDDSEEETGFAVADDVPDPEPEDVDEIFFEFSESPPIQTYFLPLDPVKGAINYVSLDDVAERLGLTRDVFLKEYTSLPVQTSTLEAVLAHCQCLGTDVVDRLHQLGATGPLKLVEYSDVIRHLLEAVPQHLSTIQPDPELLAAGALPWDNLLPARQSDEAGGGPAGDLATEPADMDCFDWNEQFEQLSARAGEASKPSVARGTEVQAASTTGADIYRGLFHGGAEEDEDEEGVDELYLTAMGLDESSQNIDQSDGNKKEEEEIFFRKPY